MVNESQLRAYVIGQTPRPDLTAELEVRLPGTRITVVGALDGLSADAIVPCVGCDYPLETRLRDGTRVVVDAATMEAHLQRALDAFRGEADAHLVLCAGPFPGLSVAPGAGGRAAPLIRPFDTSVRVLRERDHRRLAVLVPFEAQAAPAARKWREAGFLPGPVRALSERPAGTSVAEWVASWVTSGAGAYGAHGADVEEGRDPGAGAEGDGVRDPRPAADAVVFDYVGFPAGILSEVAAATGLPVVDLGRLALDVVAETLRAS